MSKKIKRYTQEFKQQIVQLYTSGKSMSSIAADYEVGKSTIAKWVSQSRQSGSFKAADNRSEEENELIELRKLNKQLLMENDILKQAALIMGRK